MERIGEYLVKRLVGEGGMGKVYEAEERLTQRRVALKVLRPELTRSEEGRRLFLNEMQILAHLEHPNIVRSLASMEVDGQLVMALEFLEGRTLREELVARGALPWKEAVEIVGKIAEALVVAHTQAPPIIHRDLKPENVMLTGRAPSAGNEPAPASGGGLKVMDFGIAKVLEAAHATNTQSIGTLQYMSPEQIDAHTIDARSDLYSLGLILFEMLSGGPPFRSASPRELLNMQCTSPAPELTDEARAGLPRTVEGLLFALMEKAPADRPESASAVVERLAPFRAAGAGASLTTGSGRKVTRASRVSDAAAAAEPRSREAAPISPDSPSAKSGDTKHSGPKRAPRTDTIALVENATAPRQLPTYAGALIIVALSIVAGLTTYVVRMHAAASTEPAVTATTSANAVR